MYDSKELDFLLLFLKNHNINTYFYEGVNQLPVVDLHIRETLGIKQEYVQIANLLSHSLQSNCIYKVIDSFACTYFVLSLPTKEIPTPLIVGPYVRNNFDMDYILHQIEAYHIPPHTLQLLQQQYANIPVLLDDTSVQTMLHTFAEILWKTKENFTTKILELNLNPSSFNRYTIENSHEILLNLDHQMYDSYLSNENRLVQAVSQGDIAHAEEILASLLSLFSMMSARNLLQNLKNYTISLNALYSKSAQLAVVNTYEIYGSTVKFMQRLELCTSPELCISLIHEMTRKYCLLIKNHTMRDYSPLIQEAIQQINLDLCADLSLHTMAERLNTNASYLSAQFRKITGSTYTEYVQKKRIEHALLLLNTTNLQIQTIAQYCGIPDLNYFSKLFKKHVHYSPNTYRKAIMKQELETP